jgi:hypothetical protein
MNSTTAASVWRSGLATSRAPLISSSKAGRSRLPPAEMMYWATSRTSGTSVLSRLADDQIDPLHVLLDEIQGV